MQHRTVDAESVKDSSREQSEATPPDYSHESTMNTNVHDSYRIIVLLGLLISVSLWPSAGYSQQAAKLERIQFTGLKKVSADQAVALSELKIGQTIDAGVLDAAAAR